MWSQQLLVLLPKLKGRALEVAARSMRTTASPRTLRESMEQLDAVGFTSADVLALARKRPTALAVLATRSPAPMLGMLREQLGVADPGALLRAQPALVTLDAPRVIAAAAFMLISIAAKLIVVAAAADVGRGDGLRRAGEPCWWWWPIMPR